MGRLSLDQNLQALILYFITLKRRITAPFLRSKTRGKSSTWFIAFIHPLLAYCFKVVNIFYAAFTGSRKTLFSQPYAAHSTLIW